MLPYIAWRNSCLNHQTAENSTETEDFALCEDSKVQELVDLRANIIERSDLVSRAVLDLLAKSLEESTAQNSLSIIKKLILLCSSALL